MNSFDRRRTRSLSTEKFTGFGADPFAGRVHFLTDGNAAAGAAGATTTQAAGAGDTTQATQQQPDVIPRAEAKKAFAERDAAKAAAKKALTLAKTLAAKVGVDADELELIETDDPNNPFDLKGESLERLTTTLTEAQKAKIEAQKKKGNWDEREKELNDAWAKKMQKALADAEKAAGEKVNGVTKRQTALEKWIDEQAGINPLREALAAEGAVHDGSGNYDDLIALLKPRIKREIAVDEETGKATVVFTPMSEDGQTPMTDTKGTPASVRQLVAEWLGKRPHLKASRMTRGPGAGGAGGRPTPGGAAMTDADRAKAGLAMIFGKDAAEKAVQTVR